MNHVYILWHTHEFDDGTEDSKLLGVYSSELIAQERIAQYSKLPGFKEQLNGFEIVKYQIDLNHWKDGFITKD